MSVVLHFTVAAVGTIELTDSVPDTDKVVPYMGSRNVFDQLKKLNGNAKLTTLGGKGHGSSYHAFRYKGDDSEKGYINEYASDRCDKTDHVWDWLFLQRR